MSNKNDNTKLEENRRNLEEFLQEHIAKENDFLTHTAFGPPWGRYNISDEDNDKFLKLYCCALGNQLHIVERPKKVGPLLIDIDLRFSEEHSERKYNDDDIKQIIASINTIVRKYYKWSNDTLLAFVMEKKNPTIKIGSEKKEYKDGFHIQYPNLSIPETMRYLIVHETREFVRKNNYLRHLPFVNSIDDVFDVSVVARNGWMMYGSRKHDGQYYHLTHIYYCTFEEKNIKSYKHTDLVKLLSNRRYTDADEMKLKETVNTNELTDALKEIEETYYKKPQKDVSKDKKNTEITRDYENYRKEVLKEVKEEAKYKYSQSKAKDIKLAKDLVKILSKQRATVYNDWIKVGWALNNISFDLLDTFKEFSQQANNYDEESCEKVWRKSVDKGLTIGSIRHWAKLDNPDKYADLMTENVNELIVEAESGTEYDIAKVAYELYKDQFRCTSITHDTWYEFQNHRWVEIDQGYTLDLKISEELTKEFAILSSIYLKQMATKSGSDSDLLHQKATKILNIVTKLKKSGFKKSVLTECKKLFYDEFFEEKLDSNNYLIGFDNGVYDLKEGTFRAGTPDDYVSLTTGYTYKEYSENHPHIVGIKDFFSKVQTENDMREYILTLLSSYLDGNTKREQFVLWTGTGCHAPGTKIMMYDGSLKNVEDIRIKDKLMGNDNTPRKVKHLYQGTDEMYKITPLGAEPYIVNKEHRLSLKFMNPDEIYFDKDNSSWKVKWIELNEDGFVIQEECLDNYEKCVEFQKKISETNDSYIPNGHNITIKLSSFLKIPKSIRKLFVGYKSLVNLPEKDVEFDPYLFGYWLSTDNTPIITGNFESFARENRLFDQKYIPKGYFQNSYHGKLQLLTGFLNNRPQTKNGYDIDIQNRRLLTDIINLTRSLGFQVKLIDDKYVIVDFNPNGIQEKDLITPIKIEHVGEGSYYGFELDDNQTYLLHDTTTTKNSNGKSKTVELFQLSFGEYCGVLPTTVLTRKRGSSSGASPELAEMRGKRFVVFQEPENDDQIQVGFMKELTGGDWIYARPLYKDPIRFKPQFKLLLTCNKLPQIPSTDGGTWRRLRVSPWESEFVDDPKYAKQFKKDYDLVEKLEKWKKAFAWYLIKVYYPKFTKYGLREPAKVTQYTNKYKKDSDIFFEFIENNLVMTNDYSDYEGHDSLFAGLKHWYSESYSSRCPFSKKDLVDYLEKNNYKMDKSYLYGVKFNTEDKKPSNLDFQ